METPTSRKLTNGQVVALIDEISKAMDDHTRALERLISTATVVPDPEGTLQLWLAELGNERIAQSRRRFQAAPKSVLGIGWIAMALHEYLQATEFVTALFTDELKVKESDKKKLHSALEAVRHSFDNLTKQFNAALQLMEGVGSLRLEEEQEKLDQVAVPDLHPGIRQVQVDWSPQKRVDYYIISYSEGTLLGTNPETVLVGGKTHSTIVDDLENGQTYAFTVTAARGDDREVSPSGIVGPLPNVPGPVQNLNATTDVGTVTLSWDAGVPDSTYQTSSFVISYQDGPIIKSITVDPRASAQGSGYGITVDGLRAGGRYTFTVVAWNQVGPSDEVSKDTPQLPSVPDAPVPRDAVPDTDSVTISWSPPANDNGSAITKYVITVSGPGTADTVHVDGKTTSLEVDDLVNDGTYSFSVAAINGVGPGPSSSFPPVTLPVPVPVTPPTTQTIQDVAIQAAELLSRLSREPVPDWMNDFVLHLANFQLLLSENDPGIDPSRDRKTVTNIMDDYQAAYKRLPALSSGLSNDEQLQVSMLALHAERFLAEISKQIETVMNQGDLIGARS